MTLEWRNSCLILSFLVLSLIAKGQISGYVYDNDTKLPLEFCNVFDRSSNKGAITDQDGKFSIQSSIGAKLIFSFTGYHSEECVIENNDLGLYYLVSSSKNVQEVTVIAKEDPAIAIMKIVVRNNKKDKTDEMIPFRKQTLKVHLNDRKNSINPLNKSVLFQYYSDLLENGVPIYVSTQSYKNDTVISDKSYGVGVDKEYFKDYINSIDIDFDLQSNTVNLFGRSIITPISNDAFHSYKYYLLDSSFVNNEYCYKIKVVTKHKRNVTFNGIVWINKNSYQLQKAELYLNSDFVNHINNISLIQDFNNSESSRYQYRSHIQFSVTLSDRHLSDSLLLIIEKECAWEMSFKSLEKDSISSLQDDLTIIKSLKNDSHIKLITKLSEMFVSSFFTINMVDIGPIYHMHTSNKLEGKRVSLLMRTNKNLFNNALILGYIGRGFGDCRNKYGFQFKIRNKEKNSIVLSIGKKLDVESPGGSFINKFLNPNRFNNSSGNILSSIFKRSDQDEMIYIDNNELTLMKEFDKFEITLYYTQQKVEKDEILLINDDLSQSSLGIQIRYSLSEKVKNHFDIIKVKSHLPVLFSDFNVTNTSTSSNHVINAKFAVLHTVNTSFFGRTKYLLDFGLIRRDDVNSIYDLELHRGNQSYIYEFTKSSLMNKHEFISDRYAALYLEHHFNGRILNRIPLIKRLNLREVFVSNVVFGNLHTSVLENIPSFTIPLSYDTPYIETGVGIENIFKILRVNAIWRLSHQENDHINLFGITGSIYFVI